LISYMGFEPEKDIKIEIIGVREGERLEEPLWSATEYLEKTDYEKIMRLCDKKEFDSKNLNEILNTLYPFCFYSEEHKDDFRNKETMRNFLEENKLLIYKKE